jgi:hypothetical protein
MPLNHAFWVQVGQIGCSPVLVDRAGGGRHDAPEES